MLQRPAEHGAELPSPQNELAPLRKNIYAAVRGVFSRPANLQWYCQSIGVAPLDTDSAVDDFFRRSEFIDVSPTRFFDPQWFRARFPVTGVNAFLSHVTNERQRLAPPSPLFAPRWYSRTHRLVGSATHPLLDFMVRGAKFSPHPLLDVRYLKKQSTSWISESIALEFLQDGTKHRLQPHPLFDSDWYLKTNPDVADAHFNPLEHYLYFGSAEARDPNRFFNSAWYRDVYFNPFRYRQADRAEPLTEYVTRGSARGQLPGPGLYPLAKTSMQFTSHGPKLYCDCVEQNLNLFAKIAHRPEISPSEFNQFLFRSIERYNPSFQEDMVLLRLKRIALMYSAKSASGKILYWWLEQLNMLKSALRFSEWSHEFEETFRNSREFIIDGLTYDPQKYHTYKFVRHPALRTASAFVHLLMFPGSFGLLPQKGKYSISFLEFLDMLESTDLMQRDGHCRPQLTGREISGLIRPKLLKLEDGLEKHFAFLERQHGLPAATFEQNPKIHTILAVHTKQPQARITAGPADCIRFGQIPMSKSLLTPDAIDRIFALYRGDFDAYGYGRTV